MQAFKESLYLFLPLVLISSACTAEEGTGRQGTDQAVQFQEAQALDVAQTQAGTGADSIQQEGQRQAGLAGQEMAQTGNCEAQLSELQTELAAIREALTAGSGGVSSAALDKVSANLDKINTMVDQLGQLRLALRGSSTDGDKGPSAESVPTDSGEGAPYASESQMEGSTNTGGTVIESPVVAVRPDLLQRGAAKLSAAHTGYASLSIYLDYIQGVRYSVEINGLPIGIYESDKNFLLDRFLSAGAQNTIAWEFPKATNGGPRVRIFGKMTAKDENWFPIYEWHAQAARLQDTITLPFAGTGN